MLSFLWDVGGIILKIVPWVKRIYSRLFSRHAYKSWKQVLSMLEDLHTKISSEPFHPDVIVGVNREGSIVASIFAFNWRYKPYCVLERKFISKVMV